VRMKVSEVPSAGGRTLTAPSRELGAVGPFGESNLSVDTSMCGVGPRSVASTCDVAGRIWHIATSCNLSRPTKPPTCDF
jgi:hypothetical protein